MNNKTSVSNKPKTVFNRADLSLKPRKIEKFIDGKSNFSDNKFGGSDNSFRYSSGSSFKGNFKKPSFGNSQVSGKGRVIKSDITDINKLIRKEVAVSESESYEAKHKFTDFGLPEFVVNNIAKKGITTPSAVQDQAIPVAMSGKDTVGIASTGTGKTLAFLLPIITKLSADPKRNAIVLAPTRELAQQIDMEWRAFSAGSNMYSALIVGRASMFSQVKALQKKPRIVIGTPGRVLDLINQGKINMKNFDIVVLDEADRMLDMGFVKDMKYIMSLMPEHKQGLFFSATFADDVKVLTHEFLKTPTILSLKTRDTTSSVMQDVVRLNSEDEKLEALYGILRNPEYKRVIIFREMKHQTTKLADNLVKNGFKVLALNGNMSNNARNNSVTSLKKGLVQTIVATDVAARGLDIDDVNLVINYDLPQTYDTYVHRIGRTGRGTKVGHALTFVVGELKPRSFKSSGPRDANRSIRNNGSRRQGDGFKRRFN